MIRAFSKSLVTPLIKRTYAASGGAVRSFKPLRVSVFSSKPYDKKHLDEANQGLGHTFDYHDEHLSSRTAVMAVGSDAVCTFVNDHVRMGYRVLTDLFSFFSFPFSSSPVVLSSSPSWTKYVWKPCRHKVSNSLLYVVQDSTKLISWLPRPWDLRYYGSQPIPPMPSRNMQSLWSWLSTVKFTGRTTVWEITILLWMGRL